MIGLAVGVVVGVALGVGLVLVSVGRLAEELDGFREFRAARRDSDRQDPANRADAY